MLYENIKQILFSLKKQKRKWRNRCDYKFDNRSKNRGKMCYVLAGYKSFLYSVVFARLAKFLDEDIDVCIISSGMYSKELSHICEEHDWSYLSIKKNNVSLAQNTVIRLHPSAEFIYKLDEDIFVTAGYFKKYMTVIMR
jgi:hypothetical protein